MYLQKRLFVITLRRYSFKGIIKMFLILFTCLLAALVITALVIQVIYADDFCFVFNDLPWYLYPLFYPYWFMSKLTEAH